MENGVVSSVSYTGPKDSEREIMVELTLKDLRTRTKALKKFEYFHFETGGRRFKVTKLERNIYHLKDEAIWERSRFRNGIKGIMEDLTWVLEMGCLPRPVGNSWGF